MFDTRMEVLEKSIDKHTDRILNDENRELVEIHHLFYDEVWFSFLIIFFLNIILKHSAHKCESPNSS